jgi:hypothetical protein
MSLRVGLDLDGVLADFRSAFETAAGEVGVTVHATSSDDTTADPLSSRDVRRIWEHVKRTPNWWVQVKPYEPNQITRLYEMARRHRWEVVFMTRRPSTAGDPVQFQTQWWLEQQGFYYPAAVTVPGSRGELANALRLDVVIDDQIHNCVDVISASTAKALLLLRDPPDTSIEEHAVSRGIGVVSSLEEALDVIEHLYGSLTERRGRLQRLADWFTGPKPSAAAPAAIPARPDSARALLRKE